jgi:hypothetical protein
MEETTTESLIPSVDELRRKFALEMAVNSTARFEGSVEVAVTWAKRFDEFLKTGE